MDLTLRAVEQQMLAVPALPAVAGMQGDAALTQATQPGAQQGGGFHFAGEYAAGTADKGVDAKRVNPAAQLVGGEVLQPLGNPVAGLAVALDKGSGVFGVGDVHAADAGQQELAPDAGHGVVEVNLDPGSAQGVCCHEAGRAATDDDDWGRAGHAWAPR